MTHIHTESVEHRGAMGKASTLDGNTAGLQAVCLVSASL